MIYDEEIILFLKHVGGTGYINKEELWTVTKRIYPGINQANETVILRNLEGV